MKIVTSEAREQLVEVATETRRGVVAVLTVLFVSTLLYLPAVAELGVARHLERLLSTREVLWYTVCSITGAVTFVSASLLGDDGTDTDATDDGRENVEVGEALWVMFVQVAKVNAVTVLLFSGVVAGLAVESILGVDIALLVAVCYPAVDMCLYQWLDRPVTPVTVLMVVSYLPAVVVTAGLTLTLVAIGLVLGPPWAIVKSIGERRESSGPTLPIQKVVRIPTPRRR